MTTPTPGWPSTPAYTPRCSTCNAVLTDFSLREPMPDRDGVFHAYDCPAVKNSRPAQPVTVSEEQVHRALKAVHGDHYPSGMHPWEIEEAQKDMRAAIVAALSQ